MPPTTTPLGTAPARPTQLRAPGTTPPSAAHDPASSAHHCAGASTAITAARPEARWVWALAREEDVQRISAADAAAIARCVPEAAGDRISAQAGRAALRSRAGTAARAVVLRSGVRRWVLALARTCCPEVIEAHPTCFRQVGVPVEEEIAQHCHSLLGTARLVLAIGEHWPDRWIALSHRSALPAALVRQRLSTPQGLRTEEVVAALRAHEMP
ncbi:hypothetical protein GTQ99_05400 [Kineococcus sp. T13]|uniref:hypothetical protein n=1 Tax=Kineococcus vitellinus TaxID=2696565 RepID=UPI001412A837|nr:hypothetical protein [Kineococcus vitellinus]NAZ74861.1 hypothetical protein [Kineococcus vitellinus]